MHGPITYAMPTVGYSLVEDDDLVCAHCGTRVTDSTLQVCRYLDQDRVPQYVRTCPRSECMDTVLVECALKHCPLGEVGSP